MSDKVIIYTDGGAKPNPGPGGWAALLIYNGVEKVLTGGARDTTNNRMELTAACEDYQRKKERMITLEYILIAGVNGLAEREWPGRRGRVGEAIIGFKKLRGRCVMTTYDPDTQVQDLSVLRRIVKQFGGRMALDCDVIQEGRLAIGDSVEVL